MVKLDLYRCNLGCIGPIHGKNTMRVLPRGSTRRQKIVVGDGYGRVMCLQFKRGNQEIVFQKDISSGNPISAIDLIDSDMVVVEGTTLHRLSRKGKILSKETTNLSDAITNLLAAPGGKTWVTGDVVYASYLNGREQEYIRCTDQITSLCVIDSTSFISLADKRVIAIKDNQTVATHRCKEAVTAMLRFDKDSVLCGTEAGTIGIFKYSFDDNTFEQVRIEGELSSKGDPINVLCFRDESNHEVAMGRESGLVEIYKISQNEHSFGDAPDHPYEASLLFSVNFEESIRSIQIGTIITPGFDEVVVCTISGQLISLTTEPLNQKEDTDKLGRDKATYDADMKLQNMKLELATLQQKIDSAKAKLSKQGMDNRNLGIGFTNLHLDVKCFYSDDIKAYSVIIDMPILMEMVVVQSTTPAKIIGFGNNERNEGVVASGIAPEDAPAQPLQMVFRCTEPMKRMELKLLTVEGQYGDVSISVVAKVSPKIGKRTTVNIKPLSMHQVVSSPINTANSPINNLVFSGKFTLKQAHEWLAYCLPNVPSSANVDPTSEKAQLYFQNSFVGSILTASYGPGELCLETDSVSTLAILREVISKLANQRKIAVDMKFHIDEECTFPLLQKIDMELQRYFKIFRQNGIADALKEITFDLPDKSFLDSELQSALNIDGASLNREIYLQHALFGIVYDLYIDIKKFKGIDARSAQIYQEIGEILSNYSFDRLVQYFNQ